MKKHTYNLLLIEDDPEDAQAVQFMLSSVNTSSYQTHWARNLEEVAGIAEEHDFDVILLDFYLGADTAEEVMSLLPASLHRVAKIILTGKDSLQADERSYGMGVDFFLSKNRLDKISLERAIRYAIRNREQQSRLLNFARFVAHDLKGPIGNAGNSIRLLREAFGPLNEEQQELIEVAEKEFVKLFDLITELHDYSLSQNGKLDLMEVDLGDVLKSVLDSLASEIEKRNGLIIAAPLPIMKVDPQLMQLVFQNLIQNALKYNRGSHPTIHVEGATINGQCILSFKDNGIGIDPASRRRIFHPLVRLHGQSEFEGTGLGLAICKEIVEQHGGSIWVDSAGNEKGGAEFVIQMPCQADETLGESQPLRDTLPRA